jgi:hypothetical protein
MDSLIKLQNFPKAKRSHCEQQLKNGNSDDSSRFGCHSANAKPEESFIK